MIFGTTFIVHTSTSGPSREGRNHNYTKGTLCGLGEQAFEADRVAKRDDEQDEMGQTKASSKKHIKRTNEKLEG